MSYLIYRTNGTEVIPGGLPENRIDRTATPVALIGKLVPDYGEAQSTNFVHMLEHFANNTPPSNPIKGLIWFNTSDNTVWICSGENPIEWKKFAFVQDIKPIDPDTGDFFYDTEKHQLFVFDGVQDDWVCIGPTDVNSVIEGTDETTSSASGTAICNIPIPKDSTCNIDIKIVGREVIPESFIGLRQPEVGAWNTQCIVSSYAIEESGISTYFLDLINQPFVQKLGSTDYADRWYIDLETNTNTETLQLKINASGIKQTDGTGGDVNWKIYYKIIKVD